MTGKTPAVAVVNREFARELIHSDQAVGRYFKNTSDVSIQIVGIVADGKNLRLSEATEPAIFFANLAESKCRHGSDSPDPARSLRRVH
jgi:hypothetical protein